MTVNNMTATALKRQAYRTVIENYLVRFRAKIAVLLQFFSLVHYMHNLHDITGGTLPTWCNNTMTWLLVSHCTQPAASWMKVRTSFSSRSRHLTSSFAALSITTATRGRRPTTNVNVVCDEPLSQSTGCIWLFLWWAPHLAWNKQTLCKRNKLFNFKQADALIYTTAHI